MIKYLLYLVLITDTYAKGSFPCPVKKNKNDCEKNNECKWVIGYKRPIWYNPLLWVRRDRCKYKL